MVGDETLLFHFIFTKLLLFSIFEVSVHFNFIPKVYIIVNIWQFVIECLKTKEVLLFRLMDCVRPDSGSAFYLTFLLNYIHLKSLVTWVTGHHDVMEHKTSKRCITCQINLDQNIKKNVLWVGGKHAEFDCNVEK